MEGEEFDMENMKQAPHSSSFSIFHSWDNRKRVATRSIMETHNHLGPRLELAGI